MENLGERREKILAYLRNQIVHRGVAPTINEIMRDCEIKGIGSVVYHLSWLERFGYIKRGNGFRNIRILREFKDETVNLPLVGTIKAGLPNIADQKFETFLNVSKTIAQDDKNYFLLRVSGDSMKNAGILPGDIVVIKKGTDVQENDIVVAVIEDEATLKRLVKAKNGWILKPDNEDYQPIILKDLNEVYINGKVVGKVVSEVITGL